MKISVVIPTYNRSTRVVRAVSSVLAQSYEDYEVIVVDDGSTDETRKLLEPYSQRIRYIYQENAGPAAARNNGITNGVGEWIAFLDSDDTWLPSKLASQLSHCINLNADLCFHDLTFSNPSGNNISSWNQHVHKTHNLEPLVTGIVSDAYERMMTIGHLFLTTTFLVKRSVIPCVGLFNENLRTSEDLEFYFRLAARYRVAFINDAMALYSPGSHRVTDRERLYRDRISAIKESLADRLIVGDSRLARWAKKGLLQEIRGLAGLYRNSGYYYAALRTYAKYFLTKGTPLHNIVDL